MRYNINACLIYDATDGSLTLPGSESTDSQLTITASALLSFFLRNTGVISREEVLKKVWDDNGLTSSNSNLNQYLSMLRKTCRHYGIDNIIVTISRGHLQLNPDISVELLDSPDEEAPIIEDVEQTVSPELPCPAEHIASQPKQQMPAKYWHIASAVLLVISLLLLTMTFMSGRQPAPVKFTQITHDSCELQASDDMLRSVTVANYGKNFNDVRQRLKLACKPSERFVFFYGDRLQTSGLGRVFLAHCAMYEDNPFSYCENYFYYSWKP